MDQDLNIKPNTLNLIQEKVLKSHEVIGVRENFLNRTPMAYTLRSSIDKWDLMKLERFYMAKHIVNNTKKQPTNWGKYLH